LAQTGYPEGKTTSNHIVGIVEVLGRNSALMRLHNRAAQVKTYAHAFYFGREEGLIKPAHDLGWEALSSVGDRKMDGVMGI
jgi:hypothetical protein